MNRKSLTKVASQYRADNQHENGVVLIFESRVYGWKNELRNPESERPGSLAIDVDGQIFEAQGGNDYDGAKAWVLIN